MSSAVAENHRSTAPLKSVTNRPAAAGRSNGAAGPNGGAVLARLLAKDRFEYLMRQTRVTVGRTSARSEADVDMGSR